MLTSERANFAELLASVHAFYRQDYSDFALDVWWAAMQPFDLDAVKDALNRHAVNPDNGQFLPKPADVVKLLGGSTLDRATMAWTKAIKGIHHVGTYESVCFDDPIINAVILEMGGWIDLGKVLEKELPFKQREFEGRYRAYLIRGQLQAYPRVLPGIIARENSATGYRVPDPVFIGNPAQAALVYKQGGDGIALQVTPMQEALRVLDSKAIAA